MHTSVVVFPFDQFGGAGTGAGAQLLGDAIREILEDLEAEPRPCRAHALRGNVDVREVAFTTMDKLRDWRNTGRQLSRKALATGDFLLWLGGNHLSVLPVLEELGRDALVVQFDAHLDVYSYHDTTRELSHGNYLKHSETPRPRLINVGHRDLFLVKDEIDATFEAAHAAVEVAANPAKVMEELHAKAAGAARVWIDVDADVFDLAAMPAVQQPLPFGLAGERFLKLLDAVWGANVAGMSISEFDPGRDSGDAGLQLLGWLVEFVLLRVHEE